jgi:hypothetical protein
MRVIGRLCWRNVGRRGRRIWRNGRGWEKLKQGGKSLFGNERPRRRRLMDEADELIKLEQGCSDYI